MIIVDCLHKILDDLEFLRKLCDHSTVIIVDCLHKMLESNNSVDFTVILDVFMWVFGTKNGSRWLL